MPMKDEYQKLKVTAVPPAMTLEQARELRGQVFKLSEDLHEATRQAGMTAIVWLREAGPVDTVLSDAIGDALKAFTDGSGVEVLVTERREGEGVRPCQLEVLRDFFPDLEITRKEEADVKVVVSVWKCEGCGAVLDDQGVTPRVKQLIVQGGWAWEDGKWSHCPGKMVSGLVNHGN